MSEVTGKSLTDALLPFDLCIECLANPFHGILPEHTMGRTNAPPLDLLLGYAECSSLQHDVEIHAINAGGRVILQAKIDVLVHTKAKVSIFGEVLCTDLVVCDLETTLNEVHSLLASNGDVARNLLITADAESSHSVTSCVFDRS